MDESLALPTAAVGSKLTDEESLEIQPQRCMFKPQSGLDSDEESDINVVNR